MIKWEREKRRKCVMVFQNDSIAKEILRWFEREERFILISTLFPGCPLYNHFYTCLWILLAPTEFAFPNFISLLSRLHRLNTPILLEWSTRRSTWNNCKLFKKIEIAFVLSNIPAHNTLCSFSITADSELCNGHNHSHMQHVWSWK